MPSVHRWIAVALASVVVAGCGTDGAPEPPAALTAPSVEERETEVPVRTPEVIRTVPHRAEAFTQGLAWEEGELYESTGRVGQSSLARIDPVAGSVVDQAAVDPQVFAEGVAVVDDRLVQLTWQDEVAYVWDRQTLELLDRFRYEGEGWGLCHDGTRLVMSDGTSELFFRDPETFEGTGSVEVRLGREPVGQLNELECVGDRVYANVWKTNAIVEIDPADGAITSVIDASPLLVQLDPPPTDPQAVLNGIAHDPSAGTFWLTGKLWPQLFEVRFVER